MRKVFDISAIKQGLLAFLMLFSATPWLHLHGIFYIPLFFAFYILVGKGSVTADHRIRVISLITALVLSAFQTIGLHVSSNDRITIFTSTLDFFNFLFYYIGTLILFYFIVKIVFEFFRSHESYSSREIIPNRGNFFLLSWSIIFLTWIPYSLINFPGILSPDSISQFDQILGSNPWNNHNPAFHTFLISCFYSLSNMLGQNINIGVFLYVLFQMIVLSGSFAYCLHFMRRLEVNPKIILLSLAFYSLYPPNGVYSVTVLSDVLFSGCVLVFTIYLTKLFVLNSDGITIRNIFIFSFVSLFMMLVRHVGLYVFILSLIPLVFFVRKWKRIGLLSIFILPVLIYFLVSRIVYPKFDIGYERDASWAIASQPAQFMARGVKLYSDGLSTDLNIRIDYYFNHGFENVYNPEIADPIMASVKMDSFINDKSGFYKLFIDLFLKHPLIFVESFLYSSRGYWYPDTYYWIIGGYVYKNNHGIKSEKLFTPMIAQGTIIRIVEKMRMIPIVGMIFSLGFMLWLLVLSVMYLVLTYRGKYILMYVPVFVVWLIAIVSPVFAEYRYVYPLFVSAPLLMGLSWSQRKKLTDE